MQYSPIQLPQTFKESLDASFFHDNKGYVALMATIIIGAILLVMSVGVTRSGWYARFTILGIEAKEQSSFIAESCVHLALGSLLSDLSYSGNATTTIGMGTCHVFPILLHTPTEKMVTLRVQGRVRDSFTNLETLIDMNDIQFDATALPALNAPPSVPSDFSTKFASWKELPSLP